MKLKELLERVKQQYQKITPKVRKLILVGACLVILFSVGTAVFLNNKPYETLFSGLNQEEATEIMGKLQEMGVDYKYETDGAILVPSEQEEALKAQLVNEGYPKSGFTYDIFKDNIGMTTTDFEKNSYKLFELQNRMGATIRLFEGVKDAKVTIALQEEQKYVLNENSVQKAQASVVVIMKDGGSPSAEQVNGIQRLVSKSIPGMELADVVVLDGNGNEVSTAGEDISGGANKLKLEFEQHMDNTISTKILNVLAPIYGEDNVKVSVRTTVDVDKKIREIINHSTPIEGSEKGLADTETNSLEITRDGETVGGVPGTETNAEVSTYAIVQPDGTETYYRSENAVDYLLNQLTEQSEIDSGSVQDISVSVAINSDTIGNITQQELTSLIGNAAGIPQANQAEKISIVAAPFFGSDAIVPTIDSIGSNNWIIIGAIVTGVLLLVLVVVILLVLRRRKKSKHAMELPIDVKREPSLSHDVLLKLEKQKQQEAAENKILNLSNEEGLALKNKVRDLVGENPEISAQLIRTWLRGGE